MNSTNQHIMVMKQFVFFGGNKQQQGIVGTNAEINVRSCLLLAYEESSASWNVIYSQSAEAEGHIVFNQNNFYAKKMEKSSIDPDWMPRNNSDERRKTLERERERKKNNWIIGIQDGSLSTKNSRVDRVVTKKKVKYSRRIEC